jgi:hypothetical protein
MWSAVLAGVDFAEQRALDGRPLPNRPLERAGMNPPLDVDRRRAGRSAPIRERDKETSLQ